MPRPQIRHLAMFADDTEKMAKFYVDVFDMEVIFRSPHVPDPDAIFLTDGYLTIALLPHNAEGQAVCGLNHFGFKVDSNEEIGKKIAAGGFSAPRKRPADRAYAEQRALDPEGNMFDISEHGFQHVETERDRSAASAKELAVGGRR